MAASHHYDSDVRTHFNKDSSTALGGTNSKDLKDALPAAAAFAGTWLYANLIDDNDGRREAWAMLEAAGLSSATAFVLKFAAGRKRPDETTDPQSAMYAYYHSVEPQPRSYLKDGKTQEIGANHADPGDGALYRTVHAVAINNTITPNSTTAAHDAHDASSPQRTAVAAATATMASTASSAPITIAGERCALAHPPAWSLPAGVSAVVIPGTTRRRRRSARETRLSQAMD